MTISLRFSKGKGLASELIEWYGHGPFSHVDSVEPDEHLTGARLDDGVRTRDADYLQGEEVGCTYVHLPSDPDVSAKFYDFIHAQIGKPYDKTAILGFAADRNWREDDSWFCSELAAAGLEACGYLKWRLFTPANKIDPNGLITILSATAYV
jgi:hypothetical protein